MQKSNIPQWLHAWQPESNEDTLREFMAQHQLVLDLLEDSWRRFHEQRSEHFRQPENPTEPYAPNISIDELTHSPISTAEMALFLEAFDKQNNSAMRFEGVEIRDQDWEIE